MLDLKSSPLSQTPTKLPVIPGVTLDDHGKIIEEDESALETLAEESTKQAKVEEKKNGMFTYIFSFKTTTILCCCFEMDGLLKCFLNLLDSIMTINIMPKVIGNSCYFELLAINEVLVHCCLNCF